MDFLRKYNQRAAGSEIPKSEIREIPSIFPYTIRLEEIPLLDESNEVLISGFTGVTTNSPNPGFFYSDYNTGYLTFNSSDAGTTVNPQYMGTGSLIDAMDVQPAIYDGDPTGITGSDVGSIFFNTSDNQWKGIKSDGFGGTTIVILG